MPASYPSTNEPYPPDDKNVGYGRQTWTIETSNGVIDAERYSGNYSYTGRAEALLEANIAEPRQLPGSPQCKRKREYCERSVTRFGKIVNFSATKYPGGLINVYVSLTSSQKIKDATEAALSVWPANGEAYLDMAHRYVSAYIQAFVRPMLIGDVVPFLYSADSKRCPGGYRIDAQSLRAIDEAIKRIANIVRLATPELDQSKRRYLLAQVASKADTDPAFSAAMRSIVGEAAPESA
jgi:hypothetical protein